MENNAVVFFRPVFPIHIFRKNLPCREGLKILELSDEFKRVIMIHDACVDVYELLYFVTV